MYILETLEALLPAILAENSAEIDRLLDLPIDDIVRVSPDAKTLRDFLIGDATDPMGLVIDDWNRKKYKTANETSCRIYEEFLINDELPIAGKSITDLENTWEDPAADEPSAPK